MTREEATGVSEHSGSRRLAVEVGRDRYGAATFDSMLITALAYEVDEQTWVRAVEAATTAAKMVARKP